MLRRLFYATVKHLNRSQQKGPAVALRFPGSQKISNQPLLWTTNTNNKLTDIINALSNTPSLEINSQVVVAAAAAEPTKFVSMPIVGNMPANANSDPLAVSPPSNETDLASPETLAEQDTDSLGGWIVAEDDCEILEALQESYMAARKESSSKWLDYNKTCYIYLYRGGGEPSEAMAAFDLDGTIIKPKSNKRIPKSATDWQFFSVWTKVKIQQALKENQARFVIFTNQNGVGLKIVPLEEVQERIELVTKRLNIPCTVFVAIDKDEFRKPGVGMYQLFKRSFNGHSTNGSIIDKERSFYCGDAVGYPSHSDADIKFAQTLKLPFLPPEKFLRGVKPKLVETSK